MMRYRSSEGLSRMVRSLLVEVLWRYVFFTLLSLSLKGIVMEEKLISFRNENQMEISSYLRSHARTLPGKSQLIISAFSKALEVIPRTICNNAGLDATDVLNKLRMLHARGETWAGVSVDADESNAHDGCTLLPLSLYAPISR